MKPKGHPEAALTEALAGLVESLRPGRPLAPEREKPGPAELFRRLDRHIEESSWVASRLQAPDPVRGAQMERLRAEHDEIRRLLRDLDQGRQERLPDELFGIARRLLAVLLGHLRTEERLLGARTDPQGPGAKPRPSGAEGFSAPRSFAWIPDAPRFERRYS